MSRLWFDKEACEWEEALPLGNGRLGAMVYGIPGGERIQVNEESMWYGGKVNRNNPDTKEQLEHIRQLIFDGQITAAEELMCKAMSGCPASMHPYQVLGEIHLDCKLQGEVTEYVRELDLEEAVCKVSFFCDGVHYTREVFTSHPADCLVMRLRADVCGKISLHAGLDRYRFFDGVKKLGENGIALYGNLGRGGFEYTMNLKAYAKGGTLQVMGERIVVDSADEVLFLFSADTSYHYSGKEKEQAIESYPKKEQFFPENDNLSSYEKAELHMQNALQDMMCKRLEDVFAKAFQKGFVQLMAEHVKDYRSLYARMDFSLQTDKEVELPTNLRIERCTQEEDVTLAKLYFDFGRYLLISCSRKEGLPATLQGLWNKDLLPPWDSKYTININTQMNYWPAESCNLSECHMPLFELLKKMVPNGRVTAETMYGCRGFVAHHNTDMHGDTAPQDIWVPGTYWVMGAAWLCTHVWTHYQYTGDKDFLAEYFPIVCESALFFVDFLVEYKRYKVTCPSVSPENTFILPNGQMGANGIGVTMDNQILRDLFTQCLAAYEILKEDAPKGLQAGTVAEKLKEAGISHIEEFVKEVRENLNRLMPTQISERGTILEWQEDYEEWEPGHRHISHLYGLHPSEQITMDKTPELAKAARKTLENRLSHGGGHTGWSRAWILNHYAKLWDAENAYENLKQLFAHSTYPNLFDKHPPFQIDGNFGATAAIVEILVQSNADRIVLLPALPKEWKKGHIKGVRLKGNATLNLAWENGAFSVCEIEAHSRLVTHICYQGVYLPVSLQKGQCMKWEEKDFFPKK